MFLLQKIQQYWFALVIYKMLLNQKKKIKLVKIQQHHHSGVCCKLNFFCCCCCCSLFLAFIPPTSFSSIFVAVFFVSDSINTIKFSQTNWSRQDNYLIRSSSLKFSLISYLAKLYGLIRITSCNWRNNSSYRSKHIIYHLK